MTVNNTFKRGFKTEAEKKSICYREILGLEKTAPLPAILLANHLKIKVLVPVDIFTSGTSTLSYLENSDEWSALTLISKKGTRLIIHNEKHSSARQESNIMHEIAHYLCNHPFPEISGLNQQNIFSRHYNEEQEMEAEWLGACLQLPREALIWALRKEMSQSDIAQYFNASANMVRYRINSTGALQQIRHFSKSRYL